MPSRYYVLLNYGFVLIGLIQYMSISSYKSQFHCRAFSTMILPRRDVFGRCQNAQMPLAFSCAASVKFESLLMSQFYFRHARLC